MNTTMKSKVLLLLLLSSLFYIDSYGQVESHVFDNAVDNRHLSLPNTRSIHNLPAMNVEKLLQEDQEAIQDSIMIQRFGKAYDNTFGMNDGAWEYVDEGRVWTIGFHAEQARTINFVLTNVELSDSAEIYVTNSDGTYVFGPVKANNIRSNGMVLSDIIPDSVVSISLYEPNSQIGTSSLCISKVVYGYKDTAMSQTPRTYMYFSNVACFPEYEYYSDGVGYLLMADGERYCSGALVMTTDYSLRPYFLMSYNGAVRDNLFEDQIYNIENGMYKFHARTTTCSGSAQTTSYSYYGAEIKAKFKYSDFILVELEDELKYNTSLTWLGWDRNGIVPSLISFFYHTSGGLSKISISEGLTVQSVSVPGPYTNWKITMWLPEYSLGASLLDSSNRLIGQLSNFSAGLLSDPAAYFNKFGEAWHFDDNYDKDLEHWLDPIGTNQMTMDPYRPLEIVGPTIPCGYEIYEIPYCPQTCTVEWSFEDYGNEELLDTTNLGNGRCAINNTNHEHINNSLMAVVKKGSRVIQTLEKKINTGVNFAGHFTGIRLQNNSSAPYLGIIDGATYEGWSGAHVEVFSSALNGCDVYLGSSFVGHAVTDSISFSLPNRNNPFPISTILNCINNNNCGNLKVEICVIPLNLNVYLRGNSIEISIVQDCLEDNEISASQDESAETWRLEIYNSFTGEVLCSKEFQGNSTVVDANRWPNGFYVIRVEGNSEVLTKKIAL